jgi:hypothetical protein
LLPILSLDDMLDVNLRLALWLVHDNACLGTLIAVGRLIGRPLRLHVRLGTRLLLDLYLLRLHHLHLRLRHCDVHMGLRHPHGDLRLRNVNGHVRLWLPNRDLRRGLIDQHGRCGLLDHEARRIFGVLVLRSPLAVAALRFANLCRLRMGAAHDQAAAAKLNLFPLVREKSWCGLERRPINSDALPQHHCEP